MSNLSTIGQNDAVLSVGSSYPHAISTRYAHPDVPSRFVVIYDNTAYEIDETSHITDIISGTTLSDLLESGYVITAAIDGENVAPAPTKRRTRKPRQTVAPLPVETSDTPVISSPIVVAPVIPSPLPLPVETSHPTTPERRIVAKPTTIHRIYHVKPGTVGQIVGADKNGTLTVTDYDVPSHTTTDLHIGNGKRQYVAGDILRYQFKYTATNGRIAIQLHNVTFTHNGQNFVPTNRPVIHVDSSDLIFVK